MVRPFLKHGRKIIGRIWFTSIGIELASVPSTTILIAFHRVWAKYLTIAHETPVKITLVYPEVFELARFKEVRKVFPPFGPLYLAAVLERAGHQVSLFRANEGVSPFDFRDFGIVGFSIPSSATYQLVRTVRFAGSFREDALVVVGGVHANFFSEETAVDFEADIVGIGEGESSILAIAFEFEGGTCDYQSIPGIGIRCDKKVVRTMPDSSFHNINSLPFPARHLRYETNNVNPRGLREPQLVVPLTIYHIRQN